MRLLYKIALGVILTGNIVFAQLFQFQLQSTVPGYIQPIMALGDIDEDGAFEIFLSGQTEDCQWKAGIYKYQNGYLQTLDETFEPLVQGSALFFDDDHDGDLDLLYNGLDAVGSIHAFYYRRASGSWTQTTRDEFPALFNGELTLFDYNKDGWSDLIATGINMYDGYESRLLLHHGAGFETRDLKLPNLINTHTVALDYNLDGGEDILITGEASNSTRVAQLLQNYERGELFNKDNRFIDISTQFVDLIAVDLDQDGDEDLIFSGWDANELAVTAIFYNRPTGYINTNYSVITGLAGTLTTGDFNLDGRIDFVVSGFNDQRQWLTEIWLQDSDIHFIRQNENFPGIQLTTLMSGQLDSDGKPDLMILGFDSLNVAQVWTGLNQTIKSNSPPVAIEIPADPRISYRSIEFYNPRASDDWSDTLTIRVQHRLGTFSNPDSLMTRALPEPLPIAITSYPVLIQNISLRPGHYIHQYRVFDNSGIFSDWSAVDTIRVEAMIPAGTEFSGQYKGNVESADLNGDGKPDLIVNGFTQSGLAQLNIYLNQQNEYEEMPDWSLPGTGYSGLAVFDFNGDERLDILVTGAVISQQNSDTGMTRIYLNEGQNFSSLVPLIVAGDSTYDKFPCLIESDVAIAYLDDDIYPEIILMGRQKRFTQELYIPVIYIYSYMGNNRFERWNMELPGFFYGSLAVGDLNGDRRNDLIFNGFTPSQSSSAAYPRTKVYLQEENRQWQEVVNQNWLDPLNFQLSSIKLFDFDLDDDLDIFVTGADDQFQGYSYLLRNEYPSFVLQQTLPGVFAGDVSVIDYDLNGYPDLALTGYDGQSAKGYAAVFHHTGTEWEEITNLTLPPVFWSSIKWLDFDGDSCSDLVVSGVDIQDQIHEQLFKNALFSDDRELTPPQPPTQLNLQISRDSVRFSWTPGWDQTSGQTSGLNYRLTVFDAANHTIYQTLTPLQGADSLMVQGWPGGSYRVDITAVNSAALRSLPLSQSFYIDIEAPVYTSGNLPVLLGIGEFSAVLNFQDVSDLDSSNAPFFYLTNSTGDTVDLEVAAIQSSYVVINGTVSADLPDGEYTLYLQGLGDTRHNSIVEPQALQTVQIDTRRGKILSYYPVHQQSQVSTLTQIRLTIDRLIDVETVNSQTLVLLDAQNQSVNSDYYVTWQDTSSIITLIPSNRLENDCDYLSQISENIRDTLGNPLAQTTIIQFHTNSLVQPSMGLTIFAADSSYSLYIPPFAINQETEISFSELSDAPTDARLSWLVVPFEINPSLQLENTGVLTFFPEKINNIQDQSSLFHYDSATSAWQQVGGKMNSSRFSVPLQETGIYGLANTTSADFDVTDGETLVVNPRVFNAAMAGQIPLTISFNLEEDAAVTIKLYEVSGRLARRVIDQVSYPRGNHSVSWDGRTSEGDRAKDGLYIVTVQIGNQLKKETLVIVNP